MNSHESYVAGLHTTLANHWARLTHKSQFIEVISLSKQTGIPSTTLVAMFRQGLVAGRTMADGKTYVRPFNPTHR